MEGCLPLMQVPVTPCDESCHSHSAVPLTAEAEVCGLLFCSYTFIILTYTVLGSGVGLWLSVGRMAVHSVSSRTNPPLYLIQTRACPSAPARLCSVCPGTTRCSRSLEEVEPVPHQHNFSGEGGPDRESRRSDRRASFSAGNMSYLRPRRCVLERGPDGYGFHLHGEKGKTGQFIRLVEPDTPAAAAGLKAGDRLAFVNGDSVEGESHSQVVARIRASGAGQLELIVVDQETLELLQRYGLKCQKEYVTEGIPVPSSGDSDAEQDEPAQGSANGSRRESSPEPLQENGSHRSSVSSKEEQTGPRPRLCHLKKGSGGYGFNLHSEKSRPGQFIRAVDEDSPAHRAGLRPSDKIVEPVTIETSSHPSLQAVQRPSRKRPSRTPTSARRTVVKRTWNQREVKAVEKHLMHFINSCRAPLPRARAEPEPSQEGDTSKTLSSLPTFSSPLSYLSSERKAKTSVSSESSTSSHKSGPSATATQEESVSDTLGFGLSVAQARERAHQKRTAKNAPKMDWNKRNQVFSNL
ncbi:hypothetical protein WMY93_010386 [Mugilogobius chulae]|uniref:PDZ domain-containing protein n=1 Tax=Mugilogobius chulae TaxID=88201 RepID=A0AAW0P710_9GOBI